MKRTAFLGTAATALGAAALAPAAAMMPPKRVQMTRSAGPFRIELDLLPAEPFLTRAQAAAGAEGMVALGGAAPVPPQFGNHHLVVHVYDRATGRARTHAAVTLTYRRMHGMMNANGPATTVPVVRMEAAGKGPMSTHYGNNVRLMRGLYAVNVTADGTSTTFTVPVK